MARAGVLSAPYWIFKNNCIKVSLQNDKRVQETLLPYKSTGLKRETKIFTDSKGFYLEKVIPDSVKYSIKIVVQRYRGKIIHKNYWELSRNPINQWSWYGWGRVKRHLRKGSILELGISHTKNVEYTLTEYRELRDKIIHVNRHSKIVFIECPYYSITKTNRNFASQRKTVMNNHSKAQVVYKGNKTGTDKNNNNKAQMTYKG